MSVVNTYQTFYFVLGHLEYLIKADQQVQSQNIKSNEDPAKYRCLLEQPNNINIILVFIVHFVVGQKLLTGDSIRPLKAR